MRFKIGDKVEVMNDKELLVSWRTAEVLFVSGHKYLVQYDLYPCTSIKRTVEMVSRKFVRPRPPMVQGVESYIVGDIVEVFYQYSWKVGAIFDILGNQKEIKRNRKHRHAGALQKQYLVRLLGCSEDLVIDSSNIRMRRTWHDDKWILMGKSFQSGDDVIATKPSTSNNFREMNFQIPQYKARATNRPKKHRTTVQESKRTSPYGSSVFEAHNGRIQKLRAIEKVDEKVDDVAYPKEILGRKNMHASFNITSNGYTERVGKSELNSSDSDACSVGSCSILYSRFIPMHCHVTDDLGSDAESFYESKSFSILRKEELEVSIRELELHAYRSTLGALYVSGPLSWEQEAMLTNLRIMLHISNDEHMKELKHLISTKTTISVG